MDKRRTIFTVLMTGALAVVAVFGAFSYHSVFAQAPTPTVVAPSGQTTQQGQTQQALPQGKGGFGMRGGGYTQADLATALGITTDQLSAAYKSANTEALKQAVSKGLITQAQADQIAAQANFATEPLRGLERYLPSGTTNPIDYNALLARALNITTDKLTAAYQQAATAALDAAVKNGTMTQAQADLIKARQALANDTKFQASMKSAYETALKQAVTDGTITQAQADAILAEQANRPQQGGWGFFGPDFGGRGGHGGPGGFGPNGNTVPGAQANPPASQSN